jgi:hypothetical protein
MRTDQNTGAAGYEVEMLGSDVVAVRKIWPLPRPAPPDPVMPRLGKKKVRP